MFDIRVNFLLLIGFLTFSNFVTSRNDGWLHWTQWSDCPDLICSGERNKPLVRRSRECRNTVFGEDVCGEETVEVEEKNCRPNIPECTHEWTLWTNVSFWTVHYGPFIFVSWTVLQKSGPPIFENILESTINLYLSGQNVQFRVIHQIYQRAQVEIPDHVIAITSKISQRARIDTVKARIQLLWTIPLSILLGIQGVPNYKTKSLRRSLITCMDMDENSIIKHSISVRISVRVFANPITKHLNSSNNLK